MLIRTLTPCLLAVALGSSSSARLYAAGEFFEGGGTYSVGTLNLSSPSSARTVNTVHSWTRKDLPGMGAHYCGPVLAGDARGVVYAFAGSGCAEDNGFFPAAILAYNPARNSTTVYGGVPKAVYKGDPGAATGPVFGSPLLDASRGVFYVVTSSNVANYEFTLSMLLEFNPGSGRTTALVALPESQAITAAVFDARSQLVVLAVDEDTDGSHRHRTATFDTRSSTLAWHNFSSAALPRFAGFDPVEGKVLAIQDAGEGRPRTNYDLGFLACSAQAGCNFTVVGQLGQLWSGPDTGYGAADKIRGVAWDPAERLLSVQSSGCYNVSAGDFTCYQNLGTEKFLQFHIPARLPASPSRVLEASYAYVQPTNYNDGLAMDWNGLASVAMAAATRRRTRVQLA